MGGRGRWTAVAALLLSAGCTYYRSDLPRVPPPTVAADAPGGAPLTAPHVSAAPPGDPGRAAHVPPALPTYEGERYFRVGRPDVLVAVVAAALEEQGYDVVHARSWSARGLVAARRRTLVNRHPVYAGDVATETMAVRASISGEGWESCCYLASTVSVTRFNDAGHLVSASSDYDPTVEAARADLLRAVEHRVSALWPATH